MPIHDNYDPEKGKISEKEREAVDAAYTAATSILTSNQIKTTGDDRAERLVEAIATYVVESRED